MFRLSNQSHGHGHIDRATDTSTEPRTRRQRHGHIDRDKDTGNVDTDIQINLLRFLLMVTGSIANIITLKEISDIWQSRYIFYCAPFL